MTSIKLTDNSNRSFEPIQQTLCEICQKQFSNYVCPRCNLRYCSLACYKDARHANCTESFYKDTILDEIKNQQIDNDSKAKMLEVLQRLEEENKSNDDYEEEVDNEDIEDDLAERFQNIDLDSADPSVIWNLLPDEQKREFELLVKSNHWKDVVSSHLPTYTPWWALPRQVLLEEGQEAIAGIGNSSRHHIPGLPISLPDFTKMAPQQSTRTSPHILWNLAHILGSYSYLMRHTMGELQPYTEADEKEGDTEVLQLCSSLSAHVLFSQATTWPFKSINDVMVDLVEQIAVTEQQQQSQQSDLSLSKSHMKRYDLKLLLLEDIRILIYDCKRALYHFWQALNETVRNSPKKKKKKSFILAVRKLYFYVAAAGYLLDVDKEKLDMVRLSIENEIIRVNTEKEEFQRDVEAAKKAIHNQRRNSGGISDNKIEELS